MYTADALCVMPVNGVLCTFTLLKCTVYVSVLVYVITACITECTSCLQAVKTTNAY